MLKLVTFLLMISTVMTVIVVKHHFRVRGFVSCPTCEVCDNLEGKIELWDHDLISGDDYQSNGIIRKDYSYGPLYFYEKEFAGTDPYFLIFYSCKKSKLYNNMKSNSQLNCKMTQRIEFAEPMKDTTLQLNLTLSPKDSKLDCTSSKVSHVLLDP